LSRCRKGQAGASLSQMRPSSPARPTRRFRWLRARANRAAFGRKRPATGSAGVNLPGRRPWGSVRVGLAASGPRGADARVHKPAGPAGDKLEIPVPLPLGQARLRSGDLPQRLVLVNCRCPSFIRTILKLGVTKLFAKQRDHAAEGFCRQGVDYVRRATAVFAGALEASAPRGAVAADPGARGSSHYATTL